MAHWFVSLCLFLLCCPAVIYTSGARENGSPLIRPDTIPNPKDDFTDWIYLVHGDSLQKAEILQWAISQIALHIFVDNSTEVIELHDFIFRETQHLREGQSHVYNATLHGFDSAEIDLTCDSLPPYTSLDCIYSIKVPTASLVGVYDAWIAAYWENVIFSGEGSYNHTFQDVDISVNFSLATDPGQYSRVRVIDIQSRVSFESCSLFAENFTENGVEWTEDVWRNKSTEFKLDYDEKFVTEYEVYMSETLAMYVNAVYGFVSEPPAFKEIQQKPLSDYKDIILLIHGDTLQKVNIVQWAFAHTFLSFLVPQSKPDVIPMKDFRYVETNLFRSGHSDSINATLLGMENANISISVNSLAQTVGIHFHIPRATFEGSYESNVLYRPIFVPEKFWYGAGAYQHRFEDVDLTVNLSLVDDYGRGRVRVGLVSSSVTFSRCTLWAENFTEDAIRWNEDRWRTQSLKFKQNYDKDYFPDYDVVIAETVALYFGLLWGYTGDSMREVLEQFMWLDTVLNPEP